MYLIQPFAFPPKYTAKSVIHPLVFTSNLYDLYSVFKVVQKQDEFGLTANDARTEDNDALKMAAYNGHVEVLRFLKNEFGLTAEDARTNNNEALRNAYRNGHIKVVEFFEQEWGLTLS